MGIQWPRARMGRAFELMTRKVNNDQNLSELQNDRANGANRNRTQVLCYLRTSSLDHWRIRPNLWGSPIMATFTIEQDKTVRVIMHETAKAISAKFTTAYQGDYIDTVTDTTLGDRLQVGTVANIAGIRYL